MAARDIMNQHQPDSGHEGRLVYLEQTLSEILNLIGDIKAQISVQGNQITNILERFQELEKPGESSMCAVHAAALESVKKDLAATKSELDGVKSKIWQWSGGLALAVFIFSFFSTHMSNSGTTSRLDKMESTLHAIGQQLNKP